MTNIVALVRAWLASVTAVTTLVGQRISTVLDPADGYPAIVIGPVSGGPQAIASRNVDQVEAWQVALYVYAGKLGTGSSDLADTQTAWAVAQAVATACTSTPVQLSGANLLAARVVTAAPGVDPDTGDARATVTLSLLIQRQP